MIYLKKWPELGHFALSTSKNIGMTKVYENAHINNTERAIMLMLPHPLVCIADISATRGHFDAV